MITLWENFENIFDPIYEYYDKRRMLALISFLMIIAMIIRFGAIAFIGIFLGIVFFVVPSFVVGYETASRKHKS